MHNEYFSFKFYARTFNAFLWTEIIFMDLTLISSLIPYNLVSVFSEVGTIEGLNLIVLRKTYQWVPEKLRFCLPTNSLSTFLNSTPSIDPPGPYLGSFVGISHPFMTLTLSLTSHQYLVIFCVLQPYVLCVKSSFP